jgi:N-acetylneuraminic acid mutarotase
MTPSPFDRPLSRRTLLRGATVAGAGALAAYTVGCGDEDGGASPTATQPGPPPTPPPAGTVVPQAPTSASWRRIAPEGTLPGARRDHSIVTDGKTLYVFGGRSSEQPLSDLWVYNVESDGGWRQVDLGAAPAPRFGHNAVWTRSPDVATDPGRLLVFGGQAGTAFFNDVWQFGPQSDSFVEIGVGEVRPTARYGAAGAVSTLDGEAVLFITHGFTNEGRFDDSWSWDDSWADVSPPGGLRPIRRCLMRAAWDSENDRLIMFGGQTDATPFLGDFWALDSNGWREIIADPSPPARNSNAMAFDDERGVAVLFGGNSAEGELNDVWVFDVREERWTQVEQSGESPSPRQGHDAAWVAGHGLYVFGGNDGSSDLNDLWLLTLS